MKVDMSRAALARSAILGEIAMWYVTHQKGGRRKLRSALRLKREIYVRAVLASLNIRETKGDAVRHLRRAALKTWREQLRRAVGQGVRAFTDLNLDQLALFEEAKRA